MLASAFAWSSACCSPILIIISAYCSPPRLCTIGSIKPSPRESHHENLAVDTKAMASNKADLPVLFLPTNIVIGERLSSWILLMQR